MVRPKNIVKAIVKVLITDKVSIDDKSIVVKEVDKTIDVVIDNENQFPNVKTFNTRQQMLDYVRMEASKLGFGVVIARSDNGSSNRQPYVILTCERSRASYTGILLFVGLRRKRRNMFPNFR